LNLERTPKFYLRGVDRHPHDLGCGTEVGYQRIHAPLLGARRADPAGSPETAAAIAATRREDLERIKFLTKLRATGDADSPGPQVCGAAERGETTPMRSGWRCSRLTARPCRPASRRTAGPPRAHRLEDRPLPRKGLGKEMKRRKLGDLEVSEMGLGLHGACRRSTGEDRPGTSPRRPSSARPSNSASTSSTPHRIYGPPDPMRNWSVRRSRARRDQYVIASKFQRNLDDTVPRRTCRRSAGQDSSPEKRQERRFDGTLQRLGIDQVDLYYQHRVDPNVEIEETVGAMSELVEGRQGPSIWELSEAAPETIRRAHAVHPITAPPDRVLGGSPATRRRSSCRPAGSWGSDSSPTLPSGEGFLSGRFQLAGRAGQG